MDETAPQTAPLSADELRKIDAYWRAANYLSVGQIYLYDNPLLQEPLKPEHVKPRLLGHWGTTPGLNFIYAHLNRLIKNTAVRLTPKSKLASDCWDGSCAGFWLAAI